MFRLEITPAADRDITKLKDRISKTDLEKLLIAVRSLENDPRPCGVRKIKGAERSYRIRAGGYRVVYEVFSNENMVLIIQISRRNETTYHKK
jgi:mRNA interferase RelE/StbE